MSYTRRFPRYRRPGTQAEPRKPVIPPHTRRDIPERAKQEAWGNRSFAELTPTEGTAAELRAALAANKKYTYPTYHLEGDKVIEENYYSIGD